MNVQHPGGGIYLPPGFPRLEGGLYTPERTDALTWVHVQHAPYGLSKMQYEARDEVVPLTYPHPDNPKWLGVPRTLAPIGKDDARSAGELTFNAEFTSELRPEQVPFCNKVFDMLEVDHGGIGEAPTGFGKTVCGAYLITRIGRPTCIVVPKGDLDWTGEIVRHTNIPKERIDTWAGQKLPDPNAWVVVASLQSIYRTGVYPSEVYRRFACVIFDEVHRLGAPEFNAAVRKFPGYFRLGLSATADRRDGKMDLIHAHVGWRHIVGHSDAEQPDYYVITTAWSEPFIKGKRCHFDPSRTNPAETALIKDKVRNATIAGAVLRAHKAGRRTIVFIKQKTHSAKLKQAMMGMGIPATRIIEYNGATSEVDRLRAKECPAGIVLIATYKFTAEGTNIPPLDTAVIAHPIYDPRQPMGRITRKLDGKPKPIVLDVWDRGSGVLSGIGKKRWGFMQKLGAKWKGEFR